LHARLAGGGARPAHAPAAAVAFPDMQATLRMAAPPPQVALHALQGPGDQCGAAQSGAVQPRESCVPVGRSGPHASLQARQRIA